jgi:cytoskeleton protein RodZ
MTIDDQENTNTVVLGKVLQKARLSASLTVEEVALQLNLALATVRDIEDDLDRVIKNETYPSVYLRGYIANYAKLVGLDELEKYSEYQQLSIAQNVAKNIRPSVKPAPAKKRGRWLLWLIVFSALLGGGIFTVQQLFFSSATSDASASKEVIQENLNTPAETEPGVAVKKKIVIADETDK